MLNVVTLLGFCKDFQMSEQNIPLILIVDDFEQIHEDFISILDSPTSKNSADLESAFFQDVKKKPVNPTKYELHSAYKGETAVQMVKTAKMLETPFSLCFIDIRMPPGIDGIETIRRIWEVDPDVQVVICTAYTDYTHKDILAILGERDGLVYLRKPFDPNEIRQLAISMTVKWTASKQAALKTQQLEKMVRERTAELESALIKLKKSKAIELEAQRLRLLKIFSNSLYKDLNEPMHHIEEMMRIIQEKANQIESLTDEKAISLQVEQAATVMKDLRIKKQDKIEEFHGIIGQSPEMLKIYEELRILSQLDFPILLQGESGTGKELAASVLYKLSDRTDHLFIPVNCGALPPGTIESELFGHAKGSFSGAVRDKKGLFTLADGGVIFLDEVSELSLEAQVKLLRVLQEGRFFPVGAEKQIDVDVRVISATNKDLRQLTKQGKFREDLYFRLAVVPINIPPMRERRKDIPLLVRNFLERIYDNIGFPTPEMHPETMRVFKNYPWKGNIRELMNVLQYISVSCRENIITNQYLPEEILAGQEREEDEYTPVPGPVPKLTRRILTEALDQFDGNKSKAAKMLGISRTTIYTAIKRLGI